MSKATGQRKTTSKIHFEEWMVEIHVKGTKDNPVREAVKIKLSRPRVLMSQENADVLNEGVLNMDLVNNNRLPFMYFPVAVEEPAV